MSRITSLLLGIEISGTAAFALSGLVKAARKRLDPVGVCVVVFLAAFGGGTLRDLLLDQRPFFWVRHDAYLWGIIVLSIGGMLFLRFRHIEPTERAIQLPDALGLGMFTASGVLQARAAGLQPLVSVLMGVITGVFGGVLRDIVCNEIPSVFQDHHPYASIAFFGGWICIALAALGVSTAGTVLGTVLFTVGLRVAALLWDWRLPSWQLEKP